MSLNISEHYTVQCPDGLHRENCYEVPATSALKANVGPALAASLAVFVVGFGILALAVYRRRRERQRGRETDSLSDNEARTKTSLEQFKENIQTYASKEVSVQKAHNRAKNSSPPFARFQSIKFGNKLFGSSIKPPSLSTVNTSASGRTENVRSDDEKSVISEDFNVPMFCSYANYDENDSTGTCTLYTIPPDNDQTLLPVIPKSNSAIKTSAMPANIPAPPVPSNTNV